MSPLKFGCLFWKKWHVFNASLLPLASKSGHLSSIYAICFPSVGQALLQQQQKKKNQWSRWSKTQAKQWPLNITEQPAKDPRINWGSLWRNRGRRGCHASEYERSKQQLYSHMTDTYDRLSQLACVLAVRKKLQLSGLWDVYERIFSIDVHRRRKEVLRLDKQPVTESVPPAYIWVKELQEQFPLMTSAADKWPTDDGTRLSTLKLSARISK